MPVISRFDGIIIRMYFQQKEHEPPHIHAIYGEQVVVVDLLQVAVMEGEISPNKQRRLLEWVRDHRSELLMIWETQEFILID